MVKKTEIEKKATLNTMIIRFDDGGWSTKLPTELELTAENMGNMVAEIQKGGGVWLTGPEGQSVVATFIPTHRIHSIAFETGE